LALGYHGVHVPCAGFLYRRRGESMLRQASRRNDEIVSYIQAKHPTLFRVSEMLKLEAEYAPRHVLVTSGSGPAHLFTRSDRLVQEVSIEALTTLMVRAQDRGEYGRCPALVVVMSAETRVLLERHGLLTSVLWTFERATARARLVTCRVDHVKTATHSMVWEVQPSASGTAPVTIPPDTAAAALSTHALFEPAEEWARPQRSVTPTVDQIHLVLRLGTPDNALAALPGEVAETLNELRGVIAIAQREHRLAGWEGAQFDRHRARLPAPGHAYQAVHHLPSVLPVKLSEDGKAMALVTGTDLSPDKMLRLKALARWFIATGWVPHLVAIGAGRMAWGPTDAEFASATLFYTPFLTPPRSFDRRDAYLSTPVIPLADGDADYALGTLAGFDRVTVVDQPATFPIMTSLRRLGVETSAVIADGLNSGNTPDPLLGRVTACAAFEAALDTIFVIGSTAADLCRAIGIPVAKIQIIDTDTSS
jgi:hypothetical protein